MVKLLQDTYSTFRTIFTGMGVTWKHLFTKSVTVQYPEERDVLPERVRLKLDVNMDDCIGCRLCERACPVDCITIDTIKTTDDVDLGETSTGHKKKLWVAKFDIDMAKCCYCELCVHPCPTDCITMVEDYEYSTYDRNDLILPFAEMNPGQIEEAQRKLEEEEAEKEKQKEAARLAKEKKKEESGEVKPSDDTKTTGKADPGPASQTGESDPGSSTLTGKAAPGPASQTGESAPGSSTSIGESPGNVKSETSAGPDVAADDAEKEKRKAEREARRAERRAAREAKKKNEN